MIRNAPRKWHAVCGRCGLGWNALGQAHCPTCCRHFSTASAFDMHRRGPVDSRVCTVEKLQQLRPGIWSRPGDPELSTRFTVTGNGDS